MLVKVKFIKKSLFGFKDEEREVTDRAAKQYFALGLIEPYLPEEKEEKLPVETKEEKFKPETKEVKVTTSPKEEVKEPVVVAPVSEVKTEKKVVKTPDKKKGKKK